MNKKVAISTLIATAMFAFPASPSSAAVSCVSQYGGSYGASEVCVKTGELQVNKEVFDPQNKKFVDNLGPTSYKFAAGEEVTFRIRVKNAGDETLTKVQVSDIMPGFLEPASGATTFEIAELKVGQTEEREIKARVASIDKLPKDKMVVCDVNKAEAVSGDRKDSDTAQVCVEKKEAAQLPKAGAEHTIVTLLSSGVLGYVGLKFARAKSRLG